MITIDGDTVVVHDDDGRVHTHGIGTPEAFRILSRLWLRSGWDTKYVYGFSWMGRPIIQLPEDMIRVQEVIYDQRPDVVVETGIAHGGSLVFFASLLKAMGNGRVIGVDIEIRPHNRAAIEAHELYDRIDVIEGSSIDPVVVDSVRSAIAPDERVLVVLDSDHTREHVLAELRAYGPLVSPGSWIVACDGIMGDLVGAPRSRPDWGHNNPRTAAEEFVAADPRFVLEAPATPFNEGEITDRVTYWTGAWVRRR